MLGIATPEAEEDYMYLDFVGLQPTGTFVAVYTVFNRNASEPLYLKVYLIPPEAVSAAQVSSFVINSTDCTNFPSNTQVWRPDGKVLLAVLDGEERGIMVLDLERQSCYPCGGIGSLQYDTISEVTFSPDSTRLLLVLNQTAVATLDTTQGMANAKIIQPVVQLSDSYLGPFNFPVTPNGSVALIGWTNNNAHGPNNGGRPASRDDDETPDDFQSLALMPVAPGTHPAQAVANSIFFSAVSALEPVALFGGQFLVSASVTDTAIAVQAIATRTGMIAGRTVIAKPNGTGQEVQYGLQLCSLSENEAVLVAGGYVYLVTVLSSGAASGNVVQVVAQEGVPVGVMPVSGCTRQAGGASFVGLCNTMSAPTFTLLSKE
jgi:hypothetical protein